MRALTLGGCDVDAGYHQRQSGDYIAAAPHRTQTPPQFETELVSWVPHIICGLLVYIVHDVVNRTLIVIYFLNNYKLYLCDYLLVVIKM